MKTTTASVSPDAIAARAYQLSEDAGWPQGRDQEFWFRAEQELDGTAKAPASAAHTVGKSAHPRSSRERPSAA